MKKIRFSALLLAFLLIVTCIFAIACNDNGDGADTTTTTTVDGESTTTTTTTTVTTTTVPAWGDELI